jgi:hypothetical protein
MTWERGAKSGWMVKSSTNPEGFVSDGLGGMCRSGSWEGSLRALWCLRGRCSWHRGCSCRGAIGRRGIGYEVWDSGETGPEGRTIDLVIPRALSLRGPRAQGTPEEEGVGHTLVAPRISPQTSAIPRTYSSMNTWMPAQNSPSMRNRSGCPIRARLAFGSPVSSKCSPGRCLL